MSALHQRAKDARQSQLAASFGVAAEDAKRFGAWRKGLSFAAGSFTLAAGTCTLTALGIVPALAVSAAVGVGGRLAINQLLPRAFSRAPSGPSTPEA